MAFGEIDGRRDDRVHFVEAAARPHERVCQVSAGGCGLERRADRVGLGDGLVEQLDRELGPPVDERELPERARHEAVARPRRTTVMPSWPRNGSSSARMPLAHVGAIEPGGEVGDDCIVVSQR